MNQFGGFAMSIYSGNVTEYSIAISPLVEFLATKDVIHLQNKILPSQEMMKNFKNPQFFTEDERNGLFANVKFMEVLVHRFDSVMPVGDNAELFEEISN